MTGSCQWFPPGRFSLPCPIDISSFPFDDQTCSLTFQSWLYDGLKLNLTLAPFNVDINVVNGEWNLLGSMRCDRTHGGLRADCVSLWGIPVIPEVK